MATTFLAKRIDNHIEIFEINFKKFKRNKPEFEYLGESKGVYKTKKSLKNINDVIMEYNEVGSEIDIFKYLFNRFDKGAIDLDKEEKDAKSKSFDRMSKMRKIGVELLQEKARNLTDGDNNLTLEEIGDKYLSFLENLKNERSFKHPIDILLNPEIGRPNRDFKALLRFYRKFGPLNKLDYDQEGIYDEIDEAFDRIKGIYAFLDTDEEFVTDEDFDELDPIFDKLFKCFGKLGL